MSARTIVNTYNPYADRAKRGPIDFAGDFHSDNVVPPSRPGRLLRFSLVATVLLAAVTSFAAVTAGPKPVRSGPLATAPLPTAAHLSSTSIVQPIGNGFQQPEQVAIDSSGNLYVADVLTNDVYKETLVAGVYTQSILRANLGGPIGVAVDSKGNVYIADSDNSRVLLEHPETDGSYTESVVPATGLGGIVFDLAVDKYGSIYIADAFNNRIVKETVSGSSYTQSVIPATGLLSPEGVTVDSHGNVYIADSFNDRIVEETLSGSSYTQSVIVPPVVPLGPAGVNAPEQIFLVGDTLYIADTLNSRIAKATYNATTKTYTLSTVATASLNAPTGVALDSSGNLFIADTNNHRVIEQAPGESTGFGSWPVGQTSTTATLTFTFDTGGAIGAPAAGSQIGGSGAFVVVAGGTCVKGATFVTGKTCTVQLTFKPESVGLAYGTARLTNSSNSTIVTVDLGGTGTGSKLIYPDGAIDSTIGTKLKSSQGVAVDLTGDVYIADTGNNQVLKEALTGNATYTQSVVAKSLDGPTSIAVDKTGDVFITDSGSKSVVEETPATGGAYTQTIVYAPPAHGGASTDPGPLALDRAGNLWVVFPGKVQEFSLVSGVWKLGSSIATEGTKTSGSGIGEVAITPVSLAIDTTGSIYIGEAANSTLDTPERILRYTPTNGVYTQLLVESGTYPKTMAVDRIGNVFAIDNSSKAHVFVPTGTMQSAPGNSDVGYYLGSKLVTQSPLSGPEGLAVDANEVVYIANTGFSQVLHESWSNAPSETFPQTVVDSTSSAIVHSVLNIGNAAVDFVVPATGQNPTLPSPFILNTGATQACPVLTASSDPETLVPGDECSVSVSFSPTAVGNFPSSLSYQANNGSQSRFGFNLSGVGIATIPNISWSAPASIVYGTPLSATQLNATAGYNGQTVPGTFTYTPAIGAVLNAGTTTLKVQFTPSTAEYSSARASVTIVVTKVPLIIVADSFSRPYGSPNPAFTASYIGFVNGDGPGSLGGMLSFATEATQQFPWGYYPITISNSSAAQMNYDMTLVDGTLVITQVPLTVTALDETVTNSSDIPNPYPCTITGFVNGDTANVVSGICATNAQSYGNSPGGAYTVTPTLGTLSATNYYFTNFTPGTLTISASQTKPVKHLPAANHSTAANQAKLKTASLDARKKK
jgi:sugar lactone lactonase YvrE